MFDVMRYRTNLDALSLKKLNENDEFVSNDIVTNDELKNS